MLHSKDDDYIPSVGSSFDKQMREAKIRAELFTKSLQDARDQEASALKALEDERSKWKQSFDEKSMMIEQLERELTHTVESLDYHKGSNSSFHHSLPATNRSQYTDELLHPPTSSSSDIKLFTTDEIDTTFRSIISSVHHQLPASVPLNRIDQQYATDIRSVDPKYIQFRNSFNRKSAAQLNQTDNHSVVNNEPSRQALMDKVAQYEEQLKKNQVEIEVLIAEKQRLKDQILTLDLRVASAEEEHQKCVAALSNAEGKLQFRASQVIEYEEQKELIHSKLQSVTKERDELSLKLLATQHDLTKANNDLRDQTVQTTSLETQLKELLKRKETEGTVDDMTGQLRAAEAYSKELHRQLNEIHRSYSIQLEESGKAISNLQQVVRGLEQSRDSFHARTFVAERDAAKFKAERDALLTLVSKFHTINGRVVPPAMIPEEILSTALSNYAPTASDEAEQQMQMVTDNLSVLSAIHASNHEPRLQSNPYTATPNNSISGVSHVVPKNDPRSMDKWSNKESRTPSIQGKVIHYSAHPNPSPLKQIPMDTVSSSSSSLIKVREPTIIPDRATTASPIAVPDTRTTDFARTGDDSSIMVHRRDESNEVTDDHRRQQSVTMDVSELQLDEDDEYDYGGDDRLDDSVDDLQNSTTGNVLDHGTNDARPASSSSSSSSAPALKNPFLTALYAHNMSDSRPQEAPTTSHMQSTTTRIRNKRAHLTRRLSTHVPHRATTARQQHRISKLVIKSNSSKHHRNGSTAKHTSIPPSIAPLSSRSLPITNTTTIRSTMNAVPSLTIDKPLIRSTNSIPSARSTTIASPPIDTKGSSNSSYSKTSPSSLYAKNTLSSAIRAKVAVNSSLNSISFEQSNSSQSTKVKADKSHKKMVKVFIPRSYTVRDSNLFPPHGVIRPTSTTTTTKEGSIDQHTEAVHAIEPQSHGHVFDDSDCGSDDDASNEASNTNNNTLHHRAISNHPTTIPTSLDRLHGKVNNRYGGSKVIVISEEAAATESQHDHDHTKSTTTLNMSHSNGSVDATTHHHQHTITTGASMYSDPLQLNSRRRDAVHDPSLLIPKRLMPGIAVLDKHPRYRQHGQSSSKPLNPSDRTKKTITKTKWSPSPTITNTTTGPITTTNTVRRSSKATSKTKK